MATGIQDRSTVGASVFGFPRPGALPTLLALTVMLAYAHAATAGAPSLVDEVPEPDLATVRGRAALALRTSSMRQLKNG